MPVTGPLSHIDISVGYPERSIPFYHALLTALGYRRWAIDHPDWADDPPRRATWGRRYGGQAGYGDRYYAVFFADPDGVKLEVCYVPSANP